MKLAGPVIGIQVGLMAMGCVDNIMVGHVSKEALAGAALGHAYTSALLFMFAGILMALDPLVSQAKGAEEASTLSDLFQRMIVVSLALGPLASLTMWWGDAPMRWFQQNETIIPEAARYARTVGSSSLAFILVVGCRQFFQALGRTKPLIVAIVIGNLINLAGNWLLVFGNWGFPKMGLYGSAWSTSISRWIMAAAILLAARPLMAEFWQGWNRRAHSFLEYRRIFRLGVPVSLHVSVELWVFSAVTFLMGTHGIAVQAGHNVAIVWASLTFMVPLGMGMAAATRVGQAIGRRDQLGAKTAAKVALVVGGAIQILSATLFLGFPAPLAAIFSEDRDTQTVAIALLPIAGCFQLFDGVQCIASGVLRGLGDTKTPALLALGGYWGLGLPLGALLVYKTSQGFSGWWWGLCAGLGIVAVMLVWRIVTSFNRDIGRV